MDVQTSAARVRALSATWQPSQWRALALLACGGRVPHSALSELALSELTRGAASTAWITQCFEQGLLVDAGEVKALGARSLKGERAVRVVRELVPHLLRAASLCTALGELSAEAQRLHGDDPEVEFVLQLYGGDWAKLGRAFAELKRRKIRDEADKFVRSALHAALAYDFDAEWLQQCWGVHAWPLGLQALSDAAAPLWPSTALFEWACARFPTLPEAYSARVLAEQALLRGDVKRLESFVSHVTKSEAALLQVAVHYLRSEVDRARAIASELRKPGAKRVVSPCVSASALLALLGAAETSGGRPKAPNAALSGPSGDASPIAGWPQNGAREALGRALRVLFKRFAQVEAQRVRLRPYQVSEEAAAWEVLVLGLTVHLDERDQVTRQAWAQRLSSDAGRYAAAGYDWFAQQAVHLAHTLEPRASSLAPMRGAPALSDLLEPDPEWRRALWTLSAFAERAREQPMTQTLRVAWYIDLARAEPAKPALEVFNAETGWGRVGRVELSELYERLETLPVEDRAVLNALEPKQRRGRLPLELIEALVGHPRVYNGARGRQSVEVVRERCCIETRYEHGHLLLEVRPASAREGLNVVVESETRVGVYRVGAELAKLVQHLPSGVRIPELHRREALDVLAKLAEHVEVHSEELGARKRQAAEFRPHVRIAAQSGAFWVELGVRPFGPEGRFFPPGSGRAAVTQHDGAELLDTERDFSKELSAVQRVVEMCPALDTALQIQATDPPSWAVTFDQEGLFSFLSELRGSELEVTLEWKSGQPVTARGHIGAGQLRGRLRRIKGWYLVTGGVSLDAVNELTLAELVRAPFTQSGRFLRLPNGDFVELERRVRQVLVSLASTSELAGRRPKLPASVAEADALLVPEGALGLVKSLLEDGAGFEADAETRAWLERVEEGLRAEVTLPSGLSATLRPYQLEGYRWLARMSRLGLGACLADDMGLGKTVQVLALLLERAHLGPALVVAPTSVCSNWLREARRFAPALVAVEYAGKDRERVLQGLRAAMEREAPSRAGEGLDSDPQPVQLLVTSYALLQQDAALLAEVQWATAVLDEAQFIKNALSMRAKAAFGLKALHRVALTGTPVENHLGDLWSIFHFLNPSLLGTWKHFQLRFVKPIEREGDAEQRAALRTLMHPFLLRRRKDEVLTELPALTTIRHEVTLTKDESLRYAVLRREIHEKLRTPWGKRQHKLQIFSEITRLRRFCCHPRLIYPEASHESSKLQAFIELVEELRDNGHAALVFSQYVDFLALVRELLDERRLPYLYLDGATPKEQRGRLVDEFQNGDVGLFLISLKAGGFGLNLTKADYVIHLDPWWNPAVEAQASDRAHRIGQERPVTVYRLITRDTIEENIVSLHTEKRALADAVLEGTDTAAELSVEQLLEVLGPAPTLGETYK